MDIVNSSAMTALDGITKNSEDHITVTYSIYESQNVYEHLSSRLSTLK